MTIPCPSTKFLSPSFIYSQHFKVSLAFNSPQSALCLSTCAATQLHYSMQTLELQDVHHSLVVSPSLPPHLPFYSSRPHLTLGLPFLPCTFVKILLECNAELTSRSLTEDVLDSHKERLLLLNNYKVQE